MPQYKLHARAFINGSQAEPGTVVEYDGTPGSNLEPLDDEARKRVADHAADRKSKGLAPLRYPYKVEKPPHVPAPGAGPVHIPNDWELQGGLMRVNLARQLGAPIGTKADEANEWIEKELERRKTAA